MSEHEILVADSLGFCSGVEKAICKLGDGVELAEKQGLPCYIYGDIVHNRNVMKAFPGAKKVSSPDQCEEPGVVVIRAHGISDDLRERFRSAGFSIIDATCPVVLRNQELVRSSDRPVIIVGYHEHSEIIALAGASRNKPTIVESADELSAIDRNISYNAVLQTTFSDSEYEKIVCKIKEIGLNVRFLNSICSASRIRRLSVMKLRDKVDAFVVIGDKMSANTRELAVLAGESGCRVFSVESADDLTEEIFSYSKIGITAGASTPSGIYNGVIEALRSRNG